MRVIRCDKSVCRALLPYSALVATPRSEVFEPVYRFPAVKRLGWGIVVEIPRGSVVRVKIGPHKTKYYLVDGDLIELEGARAKILGYNTWGWHYFDPRTNKKVVMVVYRDGVFIAIWGRNCN